MGPLASTEMGTPRHTHRARPFSIQFFTTLAFVLVATSANFFLDLDFHAALKASAVDESANKAGRVGKNATLNVTRRSSLEEGRPKMAWLMSFPNR
jgi:hypothetical protein